MRGLFNDYSNSLGKGYSEDEAIKEALAKQSIEVKPPLCKIIREGDTEFCERCGSGIVRKLLFGKQLGCLQPKCSNFYKQSISDNFISY